MSLLFLWPIQKSQFFCSIDPWENFYCYFLFCFVWGKKTMRMILRIETIRLLIISVLQVLRGVYCQLFIVYCHPFTSLSFSFLLLFLFSSLILPVYLWSFLQFIVVYYSFDFAWCICVREFVSVSLFQNTGKF